MKMGASVCVESYGVDCFVLIFSLEYGEEINGDLKSEPEYVVL